MSTQAAQQAEPAATDLTPRPGADGAAPLDFLRANRIQVKYGSLFIDPYLVIHPRELAPANEAQLRAKLALTYGINNPSFFESPERTAIALNLGSLVPVALAAKRSKLMGEVKKFNKQVDTGIDADLAKQEADKTHPFAAVVRETVENPEVDPVGLDLLKNGLAVYLLMREKLTQNHYMEKLTDYVPHADTPDQILSDLADKIGVTPKQVRETALTGGVDGVGKLLGLDPRYVADVKALVNTMAENDFGYNMIEHWHIGRQLLGLDAPLKEKIDAGMDARITAKIDEYRRRVKQHFDVPAPILAQETRIAKALELVEPIQRKLLYALGYEICYSPEVTADDVAFHKGIYGLHRKSANNLNDLRGTYRIYFSGKGDLEGSMRTLVHEIAHNLWPDHFSKEQIAEIDKLAAADVARFARMNKLVDEKFDQFEKLFAAYKSGDDKEKTAVLESANALFKPYGVTVDGLFPYLPDAHEFQYMVKYATDTLDIEGARYSHSGYDSPQERFREVLSRFTELKQVRYRGEPQLLQYLAPGFNQIFETRYLPHLERVYQELMSKQVDGLPATSGAAPTRDEAETAEMPKVREQPQEGGELAKVREHLRQPIEEPVPAPKADAPPPEVVQAEPKVREQPQAPVQEPTAEPKVREIPAEPQPGKPVAMQNASVAVSPRAFALSPGFATPQMMTALTTLRQMGLGFQPSV